MYLITTEWRGKLHINNMSLHHELNEAVRTLFNIEEIKKDIKIFGKPTFFRAYEISCFDKNSIVKSSPTMISHNKILKIAKELGLL